MKQMRSKRKITLKHITEKYTAIPYDNSADGDQSDGKLNVFVKEQSLEASVKITDDNKQKHMETYKPSPEQINKQSAYKPYIHAAFSPAHKPEGGCHNKQKVWTDIPRLQVSS